MSLKEIALLSPIFAAFISSIFLFFNNWKTNSPKIILGSFMFVSFIFNLTVLFYQTGHYGLYRYLDSIFMSFLLLFNPIYYIYIRSLTLKNPLRKFELLHFAPFLLIFISSHIMWLQLNEHEAIYYLKSYLKGCFIENTKLNLLYSIYISSKYIFALQAILYFVLMHKLIIKHRKEVNDIYSYSGMFKLNWTLIMLLFMFIAEISGIVVSFVGKKGLGENEHLLSIILFIFSIVYVAMGVMGAKQNSIFIENDFTDNKNNDLQTENINLKEKILIYFAEYKPYLNNQLKIWDLCLHFSTNRTYLSNIINSDFNMNFNSFVNKYRVEEAKKIIEGDKANNYTFSGIAFMSGFNSLASFNRAFKKFEGLTPGEFKIAIS